MVSTIAKVITGLEDLESGNILHLYVRNFQIYNPALEKVQMIFQDLSLESNSFSLHHFERLVEIWYVFKNEIKSKTFELLEMVELTKRNLYKFLMRCQVVNVKSMYCKGALFKS